MDSIQKKIILSAIRRCAAPLIGDEYIYSENKSGDSIEYIIDAAEKITSQNLAVKKSPGGKRSLRSVFNLLNDNEGHSYYHAAALNDATEINYPDESPSVLDESYTERVRSELKEALDLVCEDNLEDNDIRSLLCTVENLLTYYPAVFTGEETDISLYDKIKLTCSIANCMYSYFENHGITDYRSAAYDEFESFCAEDVFLLYSMDTSGVQSFIYTIHSSQALKTLRSRSFYLEILMEHIIDEVLERVGLSRCSLIYSGGAHCYILLPNTDAVSETISNIESEVNSWFIESFGSGLYIAGGQAACSANALNNKTKDSYSQLFVTMSREISRKKLRRYSKSDLLRLNMKDDSDGTRECRICSTVSTVNDDNLCPFCSSLIAISSDIMNAPYFCITKTKINGPQLPFGCYLKACYDVNEADGFGKETIENAITNDSGYVRCYSKNCMYVGADTAVMLYVGSYHSDDQMEKLAEASDGINKIAVMRSDVDNLGHAFVSGFNRKKDGTKYLNILRTSALSRQLSIFFKSNINYILANGSYALNKANQKRNALIVYSGGDDVFLIGAWNDVIGLSVDITDAFRRFTQDTLTVSAGIGIYADTYPIALSAKETEVLESASKSYPSGCSPTKNAVTLFDRSGTYSWTEFKESVAEEKLSALKVFFSSLDDYGKNFLYNLLFYLRNSSDQINIARYAYLLSRMEPKNKKDIEKRRIYREFSEKLYRWILNDKDRKELITAIYLYAYLTRVGSKE